MTKTELHSKLLCFFADREWIKSERDEEGIFLPVIAKFDRIKPGHGSCCTCQKCGRDYDYCVCDHNETIDALREFVDGLGLE